MNSAQIPGGTQTTPLLELLLEATQDGLMRWDFANGEATYNERWKHLLGFEGEELDQFGPTPDVWRALVHPDDLPGLEISLEEHLSEGWPLNTTVRMLHRHGGHRHILCRGATERDEQGKPQYMVVMFSDITDRIRVEEERLALMSALPDTLMRVRRDGTLLEFKKGLERVGSPFYALVEGRNLLGSFQNPEARSRFTQLLEALESTPRGSVQTFDLTTPLGTSAIIYHELRVISCGDEELVCVARDVTEQSTMELQLAQANKLEAIGHLAAGVAHEINTPMQFIGDNLHFLKTAITDLMPFVKFVTSLVQKAAHEPLPPDALAQVAQMEQDADLEYTQQVLPEVIERALGGVERVTRIVRAMKSFAHPDATDPCPTELGALVENTVTVATNEWKYVADINLELDANLPAVTCVPGEIGQVVLNMIVNASHAISDVVGTSGDKGQITIKTRLDGKFAELCISDTGSGIPEAVRSKIFDPFFTTKEVGRGTGQGLAIAHACVVEHHGGTIQVDTEEGRGTTFIVRLPIEGKPRPSEQGVAAA
jgi:PAS domain S-box-containing protein